MSWIEPNTNWSVSGVTVNDFNRIEGNINILSKEIHLSGKDTPLYGLSWSIPNDDWISSPIVAGLDNNLLDTNIPVDAGCRIVLRHVLLNCTRDISGMIINLRNNNNILRSYSASTKDIYDTNPLIIATNDTDSVRWYNINLVVVNRPTPQGTGSSGVTTVKDINLWSIKLSIESI